MDGLGGVRRRQLDDLNPPNQIDNRVRMVVSIALGAILVFYCFQPQKRLIGGLCILGLKITTNWTQSNRMLRREAMDQRLEGQIAAVPAIHHRNNQPIAGIFAHAIREGLRNAFR